MSIPIGSVLILSFLSAVGFLLSGLGWQAYIQGDATIWEALAGSALLGGLPLWICMLPIIPDLIRAAYRATVALFSKQAQ